MHRVLVVLIVLAAATLFGQRTSAQGLTFTLFERYLESLREQAGIPGLSALVLQDGKVAWESGLGHADLASRTPATSRTPYPIGGLSQTIGATLVLKKCVDEGVATLNDPVAAWVPGFSEPATLAQLLAHVAPSGAFTYDLTRFAALTPVAEACADMAYPELLADEIFSRLGLADSVPGTSVSASNAGDLAMFGSSNLARYAGVLNRIATPYRVDAQGRATRTERGPTGVNTATGIVTTVGDLAIFDAAASVLLRRETLIRAWTPPAPQLPAGFGWFVQSYNGEPIIWQFGEIDDAYSALVVKVPNRGLTFIVLANSDALAAPFGRDSWDVTASVFARLFLRVFLP